MALGTLHHYVAIILLLVHKKFVDLDYVRMVKFAQNVEFILTGGLDHFVVRGTNLYANIVARPHLQLIGFADVH